MRLDRLLVDRGIAPRALAQQLVRQGRVTVQGEVLRDPSGHVDEVVDVRIDGAPLAPLPVVVAWHKPVGVLTTLRDPWGREGVDHALPAAWRGMLKPIGRLDMDTSGLLLFTREGRLTQHLLHPRRAVPRTYEATVDADPPVDLKARLADGVDTALGSFPAQLLEVQGRRLRLTVTEGKHRMVRRMLHNAGCSVLTLHRLAYGPVSLGDLTPGEHRVLGDDEVEALRQA